MHQDPFAGLQFGVVEQHVLDGRVCHRHTGGVAMIDRVWQLYHEARGMVGQFLGEAIDMEATHTGDVLAQVFASVLACRAGAADQSGVRHHAIAGR